jgi:hypothetical protein
MHNGGVASDGWSKVSERLSPVLGRATHTVETTSKAMIQRALRARGYQIRMYIKETVDDGGEFIASAQALQHRHCQQDRDSVERLSIEHSQPVFGRVRMWDLLLMLGQCFDPTDETLRCVSQLTHSLQVADSMQAAGVTDPDLVVAALVHDLGKLLMLTGEDPANVVGRPDPIGWHPSRCGLDQCVLQWGHDQIIYIRLKDEIPDHLAWLLHYHSIDIHHCERLMDDRDIDYTARYLRTFMAHDAESKSTSHIPRYPLDSYRDLIESYFPHPILF